MFCTKCGKEIKEGMKHCPFCGEIVKKGNTAKAAVFSDEKKKLKKTKIVLIIIALLLIGGLYNAVDENTGGNSVLIGEWKDIDNSEYSIKFSKNGTFVIQSNGKTTQSGKWYEDTESNKGKGCLWRGTAIVDKGMYASVPGYMLILDGGSHGGSKTLLLDYPNIDFIYEK